MWHRSRPSVLSVLTLALFVWSDRSSAGAGPPSADGAMAAATQSVSAMVRQAILDNLKGDYEDSKNWGQTAKVVSGFRFEGHGLKPKLVKLTRQANHGLWQKYRVTLIEPEQRLQVQLANLRSVGPGHFTFQLVATAPLHGEARVERWRRGVKMLNFHAEADSVVEARLDCDVAVHLVDGKYISDVVIDPHVTGVDLRLVDLDLQRVSKLGGDAAHELGNSLKGLIAKQLRDREPKIKDKINASIAKRQDSMRFSPEKMLASSWTKALSTFGFGGGDTAVAGSGGKPSKQTSTVAASKPLAPAKSDVAANAAPPTKTAITVAPAAKPSTNSSGARPSSAVMTEEPRLPLTPVVLDQKPARATISPAAVTRPASFEEPQPPLVPVHR